MEYAISVDPGKDTTKCIGRMFGSTTDKKTSFSTKFYDLKNGDVELDGNSSLVSYEYNDFIIGEQGEIYDTSTSKTTILHKMAIYTAITRVINPDDYNPDIILTVGCPTTIFKNKNSKEEYREFIKDNPNVIINGKKYSFNFKKIIIKCEGSGIVYLKPEVFVSQRAAVLDIGGRNMNFGVYENRIPVPSTLFSNNFGATKLQSMVQEELNIMLGLDCDLHTAKTAIEYGGIFINGKMNNQSSMIVSEQIEKYVDQCIIKPIEERNISVSFMPVMAIGGTSSIILDQLKERMPQVIIPSFTATMEDFQWANVRGFDIVCKVKAGMLNG